MKTIIAAAGLACVVFASTRGDATENCDKRYASTFELIQGEIFDKHGCSNDLCHGRSATGGLDLRGPGSFDQLIDGRTVSVSEETHPGLRRVVPGRKDLSLLWLNVAGATIPETWTAPLRGMPPVGAPLTIDELEVIRLWIEEGATRTGIIPATGRILDACLPPPEPLKTEPLPPPPPGTGVQLKAPHQVIPANHERETCFVSWYDFTDQVSAEFLNPEGDAFRVSFIQARQDPLSHHLVAIAYKGKTSIHDPIWGSFTCKQGPRDGEQCDPVVVDACGEGGICGSEPQDALACIGFGPGDAGIGVGDESLFNTMGSAAAGVPGVYDEVPLKGIVVWNSHAFNLYDQPADLDVWVNFEFAAPDQQQRRLERFVEVSAIGKMHVPAFGADEVCHHWIVPKESQLLELSSHVHQRGKRFRIFAGEFTCQGGPAAGQPCSPYGPDPAFPVRDICGGSQCASKTPPAAGDCDGDLEVTVNELVTGVSIALNQADVVVCPRFDRNTNATIEVEELVAAVNGALHPAWRDPDDSLLYVSTTYVDPIVLSFKPGLSLGGSASVDAERTLTYCALYDNGFTDPSEVKRASRVPRNGAACQPTHCAEGRIGEPCDGNTPESQDQSCNSASGADDGSCDACTVTFGVSTEDEMFVLLGSYIAQ
jgi:hypothetical protein